MQKGNAEYATSNSNGVITCLSSLFPLICL